MRLTLYDRAINNNSRHSVRLLSRNGNRKDAKIIPKTLTNIITHDPADISRPYGEPVSRIICDIATWKVREVGWLTSEPIEGEKTHAV
jgi:hypothetical protein